MIRFIGCVTLNTGDAAILQGAMNGLREAMPGPFRVIVHDTHPDVASRYYPDMEFHPWPSQAAVWQCRIRTLSKLVRRVQAERALIGFALWKKGKRELARHLLRKHELESIVEFESATLIAATGGTYLTKNYGIMQRLLEYYIARASGRPFVFLTQSIGPAPTRWQMLRRLDWRRLRGILEHVDAVFVRDGESLEHLRALGVRRQDILVRPDLAWLIAHTRSIPSHESDADDGRLHVGVGVRDWPFFSGSQPGVGMTSYLSAISALVEHVVTVHRMDVTFISTCQGIPEYWTDDSEVAERIWRQLPSDVQPSVSVSREHRSPGEMIDVLAAFDFVVATRMHLAILSMMAGTPVLPIAYEFKTTELFRALDEDEWVGDIEELESRALCEQVDRFIDELPMLAARLKEHVGRLRHAAFDAPLAIQELLDDRS